MNARYKQSRCQDSVKSILTLCGTLSYAAAVGTPGLDILGTKSFCVTFATSGKRLKGKKMRSLPVSSVRTCLIVHWRWFSRASLLCLVVLVLSSCLAAQEATIVGTVTDQTGSLVPKVAIAITNTQTGAVRPSETNNLGQYVASGLPIGIYDLKAQSSGFELGISRGVVVNVNGRVRVDFQLKIGTAKESALVESIPVAVQADSGEQSSLVSGTQISELSTNGRSIYSYIILAPEDSLERAVSYPPFR